MSSQISARAAFGVFLALCSGKVFREAEPFALAYNNLLAVMAQDTICLTFGAVCAATDPVAVVALLKSLGASQVLTMQVR